MNKKLSDKMNLGEGFAFFNSLTEGSLSGAIASYYCGVTSDNCELLIWTSTLGIPYSVPYNGVANFKELLYYVNEIKDIQWLDDVDLDIITKYLYRKINKEKAQEEIHYVQKESTSVEEEENQQNESY